MTTALAQGTSEAAGPARIGALSARWDYGVDRVELPATTFRAGHEDNKNDSLCMGEMHDGLSARSAQCPEEEIFNASSNSSEQRLVD